MYGEDIANHFSALCVGASGECSTGELLRTELPSLLPSRLCRAPEKENTEILDPGKFSGIFLAVHSGKNC